MLSPKLACRESKVVTCRDTSHWVTFAVTPTKPQPACLAVSCIKVACCVLSLLSLVCAGDSPVKVTYGGQWQDNESSGSQSSRRGGNGSNVGGGSIIECAVCGRPHRAPRCAINYCNSSSKRLCLSDSGLRLWSSIHRYGT
jgi:hypothetical protein